EDCHRGVIGLDVVGAPEVELERLDVLQTGRAGERERRRRRDGERDREKAISDDTAEQRAAPRSRGASVIGLVAQPGAGRAGAYELADVHCCHATADDVECVGSEALETDLHEAPRALGDREQALELVEGCGRGLLEHDVGARLESCRGEVEVGIDRRADHDDVETAGGDEIRAVRETGDALRKILGRGRDRIRDGDESSTPLRVQAQPLLHVSTAVSAGSDECQSWGVQEATSDVVRVRALRRARSMVWSSAVSTRATTRSRSRGSPGSRWRRASYASAGQNP